MDGSSTQKWIIDSKIYVLQCKVYSFMGTLVLGPWYLDAPRVRYRDAATASRGGLVWLPTALFTALRWQVQGTTLTVALSTSNASPSAWQLGGVQWWPATGDVFVTVHVEPWMPPAGNGPWTWTPQLSWATPGDAGYAYLECPQRPVQRLYVICHHAVATWSAWHPRLQHPDPDPWATALYTDAHGDATRAGTPDSVEASMVSVITPDPLRHGLHLYLAWMSLTWIQRGLLQRGFDDLGFPVDDLWHEVLDTTAWPGQYVHAPGAETRADARPTRYWHSPLRPLADWVALTSTAPSASTVASWAPPRPVETVVRSAWARHVRSAQYHWLRHTWTAYRAGGSWGAVVTAYELCTDPDPDPALDDTVGPSPSSQWPAPVRAPQCWTAHVGRHARRCWRRTLGRWSLHDVLTLRLGRP